MLQHYGHIRLWGYRLHLTPQLRSHSGRRELHFDGLNRLSNSWTPTQSHRPSELTAIEDGHDLLVRAGFLRQAHSGIFHLLPLGLRVQSKIERLIDKHMERIGASKVSLSSLSSQELWQKSGRLDGRNSEFFKLTDRKEAQFLLAPTHEEEITTIVKSAIHSYKDLPLRLYQVSRKYRDEARPRQGLLRGREFLMKDLYTFDATDQQARETYEEVRQAYRAFLDELGLAYLVADADSGNMGGSLSHEYHFKSANGEDTIVSCPDCDFSINEELNQGQKLDGQDCDTKASPQQWTGLSKDRQSLIQVYFPSGDHQINIHAIKRLYPELDSSIDVPTTQQVEQAVAHLVIVDPRTPLKDVRDQHPTAQVEQCDRSLTKLRDGDVCPKCHTGTLALHKAVEIGHTFHLGARYSAPLEAQVVNANNQRVNISMGCHGIGVSRLIGAMASLLADDKGLNWPVNTAAYSTVIVFADSIAEQDRSCVCKAASEVLDLGQTHSSQIRCDAVIDDRDRPIGWKLKDADLVGYPMIIVVGKAWARGMLEFQCRQLEIREEISIEALPQKIRDCIARLTTLHRS